MNPLATVLRGRVATDEAAKLTVNLISRERLVHGHAWTYFKRVCYRAPEHPFMKNLCNKPPIRFQSPKRSNGSSELIDTGEELGAVPFVPLTNGRFR